MEIRVQKAYCDPRLGNIDIPCPLAVSVSSCHPQPHYVPLSLLARWLGFVRSLIDRNTFSPLLPSLSLAARASAHSPPSDIIWDIYRLDGKKCGKSPHHSSAKKLLYIFRSLAVVTEVMSALHKENLGHFVFAKKLFFHCRLGDCDFTRRKNENCPAGGRNVVQRCQRQTKKMLTNEKSIKFKQSC